MVLDYEIHLSDEIQTFPVIEEMYNSLISTRELINQHKNTQMYQKYVENADYLQTLKNDSTIYQLFESIVELSSIGRNGEPLNLGIESPIEIQDYYDILYDTIKYGIIQSFKEEEGHGDDDEPYHPSGHCKYNPENNPYWCKLIWGYCQFQVDSWINEHCPIYQGVPKWSYYFPEDNEITDEFIQQHSYMTIYQKIDGMDRLVSIGDTAFQNYNPDGGFSLEIPYVRYIGRYAFQNCKALKTIDFSGKTDDEIPELADPKAFMLYDGQTFVNETFQIKVPQRLYDKWAASTNWSVVSSHIIGV